MKIAIIDRAHRKETAAMPQTSIVVTPLGRVFKATR